MSNLFIVCHSTLNRLTAVFSLLSPSRTNFSAVAQNGESLIILYQKSYYKEYYLKVIIRLCTQGQQP